MKLAPKKLYQKFGKYFPYSTVDLVIRKDEQFILTKRNINPYKGYWHLPGGIIRKGEKMKTRAKRTAKEELNLEIKLERFLGIYENTVHVRHDISHVFITSILKGKIKNDLQSTEVKFFTNVPSNIIPYHRAIINDAKRFFK